MSGRFAFLLVVALEGAAMFGYGVAVGDSGPLLTGFGTALAAAGGLWRVWDERRSGWVIVDGEFSVHVYPRGWVPTLVTPRLTAWERIEAVVAAARVSL